MIASLWAVDDLSTMLLLRRFHAAHRTQPAPAALQAAQHWLRRLTDADVARLVAECDEAVRALYRDVVAAGDQAFRAPRRGPNGEPFWHPCYWAGFAAWTR